MDKKAVIIGGVIVLGLGAYFYFKPKKTGTDSSMIFTSCVFEPGGTINGFYYPDFCRKCGKEKQYHKYDKYNTPKL